MAAPAPSLAWPTYRHLLSAGSLSPSNPLRVIAHCDVDAAYAAMEAQRLGLDPHQVPLAVQQWNGLIAISYAARKFGITRHETVSEARKKCPDLRLVHVATYAANADKAEYHQDAKPETHKVSLDFYRTESVKIIQLFKQACPLGAVEKASIDESYFDLTLAVRARLVARYPHLAKPPTDDGLDAPLPAPPAYAWSDARGVLVPRDESVAWSWVDEAMGCGADIMSELRERVKNELGYTTSAGIASNKTLAKLCSSYKKPEAQSTMLPSAVPDYLRELPFQKIRFLGGKLGSALASEWESQTVGDLWSVSLDEMRARFGDESDWVFNLLRGQDMSPVISRTATKTMLASKSVRPSIKTSADAVHWLKILSTELAGRLNSARQDRQGLWPKTLTLRYVATGEAARSRQTAFAFVRGLEAKHVQLAAEKLWKEAVGESVKAKEGKLAIVTIALGFSGLEDGEAGQRGIEGFLQAGPPSAQLPSNTVIATTATNLKPAVVSKEQRKKREKGIAALFSRQSQAMQQVEAGPSRLHSSTPAASAGTSKTGAEDDKDDGTWTCPECGEMLELEKHFDAPSLAGSLADEQGEDFFGDPHYGIDKEAAVRRFETRQVAHLDHHYALALEAEDRAALANNGQPNDQSHGAPNSGQPSKKRKKKKGIEAFFAKSSGVS